MPPAKSNWAWQQLRQLRSAPPGLAAKGKGRARIMSAALEQGEQLMRAAAAVGPAARPLPLFYSLSQAGRAICAARLKDNYLLSSHGLAWPGPDAVGLRHASRH